MAESHNGVDSIATIPAGTVRDALRGTMVMGLPVNDADKPTFHFDPDRTWTEEDSAGLPWDWTATPTTDTTQAAVKPICTYEFFSPLGRQGATYTEAGDFTPTTVVFTMMDTDFASVLGFAYATIGNSDHKWYFRFWRPITGLGGLQVYQVHCTAEGVD